MKKNSLVCAVVFIGLISCQPKLSPEIEIRDQTKIEQITDPWEVDIVYQDSTFFLNKDLRALVQGYKNDSLMFETFNTKITYQGRSMMGSGANSKRMSLFGEELIVVQSSPHQLTKCSLKGNINAKFPIRVKNTVEVFDGFFLSEENLGLVSYPSVEEENQLEILCYNLNSNTSSILFEKSSLFPANTHLVESNSTSIIILSPYERELMILDHQGKLINKVKFDHAKFSLEYKPPYPFATSDDYFRMSPIEQLASRSDKVYDFYYSKGQLYLLIRRLSLNQERVVSRSELVHLDVSTGHSSIHTGPYVFLSFDQKGNVFEYSADIDSYRIKIFPLKDLKWESPEDL
ncbi:MAG: hypothetical protein MUF77_12800 [Leptospira sp.]|jgi:hypothetical protein|nr:hypothetical protein [Leptospira sp.]